MSSGLNVSIQLPLTPPIWYVEWCGACRGRCLLWLATGSSPTSRDGWALELQSLALVLWVRFWASSSGWWAPVQRAARAAAWRDAGVELLGSGGEDVFAADPVAAMDAQGVEVSDRCWEGLQWRGLADGGCGRCWL